MSIVLRLGKFYLPVNAGAHEPITIMLPPPAHDLPCLRNITHLGYKFREMITYRFDLSEALPIAFERL
jgi:hypothetical protein